MIKSVTFPGNFEAEGEIDSITPRTQNKQAYFKGIDENKIT